MTCRTLLLASIAALALTTWVHAAPPAAYTEWRQGPVQWLLTEEEQRAWNSVSSADEAERFIQLFWARRDATPETPINEFRAEFDRRVADADALFTWEGKRGSLTEPGRVYIVLGPPDDMALPKPPRLFATDLYRTTFVYSKPASFGLTEHRITFNENPRTGQFDIVPQGGIYGAIEGALRKAIVSPATNVVSPPAP